MEALIVKKEGRGQGKYKGKLPIKCFSCSKIGNFASRCPERVHRSKPYKTRFQKKCYYAKGVTDEESDKENGNEDEWVFIAIVENSPVATESTKDEKTLAARVEEKDEWVIDSGFSHHMTGDKRKFVSL